MQSEEMQSKPLETGSPQQPQSQQPQGQRPNVDIDVVLDRLKMKEFEIIAILSENKKLKGLEEENKALKIELEALREKILKN